MPLPRSIQQIREANGGLGNLTDFEIAQYEHGKYQKYYPAFEDFAKDIGFDVGGKWGNRLSSSVDSYQAGLYGLGEEITGSETLAQGRRRNENDALNAQQLAQSQGAITSYKDVGGIGDAADYVGGLAIDSLPYLGEAAVGGLAGRAIKTGVGITRGLKSAAGAAVASYPSAVGSILQAQREQSGGEADLGSAAALGVPFAAANALGLEGLAARAALPRAGLRALDGVNGVKGAAARTAVSGAKTGIGESANELTQEGLTQVGRMEVDPNEEFMSPDAVERFKESAVGGFALGGAAGGGLGGWRRSQGYLPPGKTVDDGSADLLNTQDQGEPLQLGFSGYNTGVGELVTMRDGTTMLRSEFEAAVKDGRYPDGSYRFEPIDLTKPAAEEPFNYEGAIDYAPAEFTPEARTPAQLEMPVGAPGAQVDLFDPLAESVADGAAPAAAPDLTVPADGATGDLFQASPSAMTPTMFNPASEPAVSAPNSPGAVARSIFTRLTQQGVEKSAFTNRLAYELSKNLGSAGQMNTYLDGITSEVEKALTKLNKLVDRDSNMLTPEEYAAKREPLEQRLLTIEAARELAREFQTAQTNAMAQEGAARASGAAKIGTRPDTAGSAEIARERSFNTQLDDSLPVVDGQGKARREAQSGEARMGILRTVMAERSRNQPVARFRKALADQGYANVEPTPEELSEIRRLGQRRADVRAATVVPPGLAAARGGLTARADLDAPSRPVVPETPRGGPNPAAQPAAKSTPAPAPAPAPKPVPQPAAPAAPRVTAVPAKTAFEALAALRELQREALTLLGPKGEMPAEGTPERTKFDAMADKIDVARKEQETLSKQEKAAKAAPAPTAPKAPVVIEARGKKRADKAVSQGADIEQLTDAIEAQTDATLYDGAVDALYRRFMETESDTESDTIMDWVKAQGKAFEKDWTGAEKRYDDTERGVRGKRGLKTGNQTESTQSKLDPDTVQMLAGNWLRWRTPEGNPAPAKPMSFEALSKIVLAIERALGGKIEVEVWDSVTDMDSTQEPGSRAGVVRNGKIALFIDGIADGLEGQKTIFHEVFHKGLRNLLPAAQYHETLNKLFLQSAQVRAAANAWLQTADGKAARERAAAAYPNRPTEARAAAISEAVDEVLADIAENTQLEPSALRKIGNWLADVAERFGMKSLAQSIRSMGVSPLQQFVNDALRAGVQGASPDPGPATESTRWRTAKSEKDMAKRDAAGGTPAKMVSKLKSTPMGYLVRDILGGWRDSPWMLGMLTLDQIKDRFSTDSKPIADAVNAWRKMSTRATEIMRSPASIHRRWATYTRQNRAEAQKLNNLFIKATINEVWVDGKTEPRLDPRNKHLDFADPQVVREAAAARKLWTELSPEGQAIYRAVSQNLNEQFRLKQDAMLKRVVDTYKDALKGALSADEMFELVSQGKIKRNTMTDQIKPGMTMRDRMELQRFFAAADSVYIPRAEVPGPYFPLTRKGDNVVVFKSKSFVELEAELNKARDALDDVMSSDWPTQEDAQKLLTSRISAAQKDVSDARERLETAKASGAQYVVEFFESASQAADREAELRAEKKGTGDVYRSVRKHFEGRTDSVPPSFISALTAKLNAGLPQGSAADVASIVRQMVIAGLPERSSMKAELKRMNVAGVNPEDVMHSYMSLTHRNGWTISRLENAADLGQALATAGQSLNTDEVVVANELKKRYAGSLQYSAGNALIDMASNLSYITHLGFSVGYYMQNLMQPWLVSMPVLAGKYGFAQTNKALADATVETVKAITGTIRQKQGSVDWEMPLDLSFFKPEERALLEKLTDDGMIDITIRADLGVGSSGANNVVGHVLQKAAEFSSLPAHQIEVVNRVATALAAYRLSRSRGNSVDSAIAEADKIVVQTHVDYSVENAPRFMNPNALGGLGRLTFQFRRYQQAMVFLWGKLLLDSIRGGDKDSAGALMYLTGTNLAMAGAAGLPIAAPLGLVMAAVGMIGEDDEERDLIEMFWSGVRGVAGDGFTDLARKGIPASLGVDMSNRIGSGSILSPIYRLPQASTGQEWSGAMALQLFGAAGGTVANWADAIMIADENPAKAVQGVVPAGIRAAFEAIKREYGSGLTDRRGNVLIGADELGGADFFAKVLNLGESTKVTNMYTTRSAIKDAERARLDVRGRLMRQYTRARLENDRDAMAEARSEIEAFNERNDPRAKITSVNLSASYKEEKNRRAEQRSGVRIRKSTEDIAEDYGVTQ